MIPLIRPIQRSGYCELKLCVISKKYCECTCEYLGDSKRNIEAFNLSKALEIKSLRQIIITLFKFILTLTFKTKTLKIFPSLLTYTIKKFI